MTVPFWSLLVILVILLAAILATVGFIVLMRLLWLAKRPSASATIITVATLSLIVGLTVLAATGRLAHL